MTQTPAPAVERQRDALRTKREILEVAVHEFAERGYSGARVDEIAAQTRTTKRMIYYYFGSKEKLYIAALERVYAIIRQEESQLDVAHLDPLTAMRRLAELTFDHHENHPDFIKLVSIENIHQAAFIAKSPELSALSTPAVEVTGKILARGYAEGVFHRHIDAIDLHMVISAFCFFRVANRHTFGTIFNRDLLSPRTRAGYRRLIGDLVIDFLTSRPDADADARRP